MAGPKTNSLASARVAILFIAMIAAAVASCTSNQSTTKIQQTEIQKITPQIPVDYAWLDSVHFELFQCSRAFDDGRTVTFYLVGEFHVYNEQSSRYADSLLALLQPSLFMSEGADSSQPRSDLMKDLSSSRKDFFGAIGYNEPELSRLAKARNIPVLWLEQIDTATGVYAGVTESEAKGLELGVASLQSPMMKSPIVANMMKKMLADPEGMYKSMMKIFSQMGMDTVMFKKILEAQEPESGIITARNELMAAKAIQHISPDQGCIVIRFGMGHSEGMIEELAKSNCECEPQSLQAFLEGE